jgi:hypothetical protein
LQIEDTEPAAVVSRDIILPTIPDVPLVSIQREKPASATPVLPKEEICWPRDWLSQDFPSARILSVGNM